MVAMADRDKGEGKARFEHDARRHSGEAMSLTGDAALRSVLAEQHAEATRTNRRVVPDCGYAARLGAHSSARQG